MAFTFNYAASPTFKRFHRDGQDIVAPKYDSETGAVIDAGRNYIRCVMGPIGSGKTVGCVAELFLQACSQWKNPADNTRRSRIAIVRDTYKNLQNTTLATFLQWFPEGVISEVTHTPPIRMRWKFDIAEDDHVDVEFLCVALDSPNAIEDLRGNEFSGAFVNECVACDIDTITLLIQRVGRWPGGNLDPEGKTKSFIIMDCNPPNIGNWYQVYKDELRPKMWHFYDQPPALLYDYDDSTGRYNFYPNVGQRKGIPKAENIKYLKEGFGYYMKTVETADPSYTLVFNCMKYGEVGNGTAVYDIYRDDIHCAKEEMPFNSRLPLILGFDYGLTPACVFAQYSPFGQLQVLDELYKEGIGMEYFFDNYLMPKLINEYGMLQGTEIIAVGDPSGNKRSDTDESTCMGFLLERNIPIEACTTNALMPRLESVRYFLNSLASGKPAFQINSKCKMLRLGLQGLYRYKPVRGIDKKNVLHEEPDKNQYSHTQDALQYIAHRIRWSSEYSGSSLFGMSRWRNETEDFSGNATYGKCSTVLV
jgi:hypothetical protein